MDVSGWTIEQRMRLPDWCFPERFAVCSYTFNGAPGTDVWSISTLALPDPCCIWQIAIYNMYDAAGSGHFRIALSDAAPINIAQMDACQEIVPHFGMDMPGPNRITYDSIYTPSIISNCRFGLVTGGKKLVVELHCSVAKTRILPVLWVSGLPTDMAGWLEHSRV